MTACYPESPRSRHTLVTEIFALRRVMGQVGKRTLVLAALHKSGQGRRVPRYFNTAGPCRPELHYMIPALERLPEGRRLCEQGMYFVIHAPRQTGKTTFLRTLAADLNASGKMAAVAFSCEAGSAAGDDYEAAQRAILDDLRLKATDTLAPELCPPPFPEASALGLFRTALNAWAKACPLPLALFFDEIDSLAGPSLQAVLRQLRAGYDDRPARFPASVVLCGMRDVRDYKLASGGGPVRVGSASPFNILVESLRIGNFSTEEIRSLYGQHTRETGQAFSDEAIERVIQVSGGQPWLVNSLAREVISKIGIPPLETITAGHVEIAKERLIRARATHLDSLAARLAEPRVRRIIEPILAGTFVDTGEGYNDDVEYVHDLGLVTRSGGLQIANPIYREVISRVLSASVEEQIRPLNFLSSDGRIDMERLLDDFCVFWQEQGEALLGPLPYHEVAPQLVLMGFLQKVVNGGGYIDREFGIGRGRIDLLVRWPHQGPEGEKTVQREALELKVWRKGEKDPLKKGLEQIDGYLEQLELSEGTLVIFDRRGTKRGAKKMERRWVKSPSGRRIRLLRI